MIRAPFSSAANKVFKSNDGGDSWTVISPDLTTNTTATRS